MAVRFQLVFLRWKVKVRTWVKAGHLVWVAKHVESVPVMRTWQGKTVWDGVVENLTSRPPWYASGLRLVTQDRHPDNPTRHVTVLHIPPVVNPITAVRAAILQEFQDAQTA